MSSLGNAPLVSPFCALSLFCLLWPVSLADTQAPAELASPGNLVSTWWAAGCRRVSRQDREAVVKRCFFEETLSECMEFKTCTTKQFWLSAKHVRQMEVCIFVVSGSSFSYSLPLLFSSQSHKPHDHADRDMEITAGEEEGNWHQARMAKFRVQWPGQEDLGGRSKAKLENERQKSDSRLGRGEWPRSS